MEARIDRHHENAVRAKADVDAGGVLHAPEEESGDAEQDDGHCNLGDHENVAEAPTAAGTGQEIFTFQRAR